MAINFNNGPYYDDFDPAKNFYRVLFKPGYAVQARELNQLQSILQHQVSTFANHIFKKNSVVIPGGIALLESVDIVQITGFNDPAALVGKTITNCPAFDFTDIENDDIFDPYITAVVLGYRAAGATVDEPAALYVKYIKTGSDGRKTFGYSLGTPSVLDTLKTVDQNLYEISLYSTKPASIGKVATLNKGTYFTKDLFVDVESQSVIVEVDNTKTTNCIIGLDVIETIVTSDDDESLLDNANGAPNQYAPGADRYKVSLVLNKYNRDTVLEEDKFILLMDVENNIVTYLNNNTQYAELMKTLARRTYDANGNFIVSGLDVSVNPSTDDEYLWVNVNRGKCYLGGYEYDQISNRQIVVEKPRGVTHQETPPPVARFVNELTWFYIAGGAFLKELPAPNTLIQLLDVAPGTVGVTPKVIGYAVFRDVQYVFGDIATDKDVYRVFFDYVAIENGFSIADIGGIRAIVASEGAPVLHRMTLSNIIGTFAIGNNVVDPTDSTIKGRIYQYIDGVLYVIKNQLNGSVVAPIPTSDAVKDATSNATATRSSTYVTNHDDMLMPMIEVDSATIKTLKTGINTTPTSYSITDIQEWNITSDLTWTSAVLSGDDVYADFSLANYSAMIVDPGFEEMIDLTGKISVAVNGKSYTLTRGTLTVGRTIRIYATVNKVNVAAAQKLVTAGETIIRTPSASWMSLAHQDIVRVKNVFEGKTVAVYNSDNTSTSAVFNGTNTLTYITGEDHGLTAGDIVVIKNIKDTVYTDGRYGYGFNGEFTVATAPSTTQFTVTYVPKVITFDGASAVDPATDTITSTAHGYATGDYVTYAIGSGGTVITGLTNNAKYYVIATGTNTLKLATSYDNAFAGSAIDITADGAGAAQTLTKTPPGTYDITSQGIVCAPPTEASGIDITNRFIAETGQTTTTIGTGIIKLKKRLIVPNGQLLVKYDYYTVGAGGYCSVDSYGTYTGDLSYIGDIKDLDGPLKNSVPVRNYIDFRTRTSTYFFKNMATTVAGSRILSLKDLNLTNLSALLVGKYVVGSDSAHLAGTTTITAVKFNPVTGNTDLTLSTAAATSGTYTYYVGLNGTSLSIVDTGNGGRSFTIPRDSYRIRYTYTRFKPKQTMVYVSRVQDVLSIEQMEVTSIDQVNALRRDEFKLPLVYVNMAPYCVDMSDVRVVQFENPVYHMLDIHEMRKKIERTEYYTSLALNNSTNTEIVDPEDEDLTTASRGFWNENFMDMTSQDTMDDNYKCTIYDRSYVSPGVVTRTIPLQIDDAQSGVGTQVVRNGTTVTLPFVEQPAIRNTVASRTNNLNPYNTINWNGKLTLSPSVDNWIDVTIVPAPIPVPGVPEDEEPPIIEEPPISPPIVVCWPPPVLPVPPVEEYVVEITNLKAAWRGSCGNPHAISFDWKTNTGRTGRVNTDRHLSPVLRKMGKKGYNGDYANSLINKRYNDPGVKEYLHAGSHFDIKPPKNWKHDKREDESDNSK